MAYLQLNGRSTEFRGALETPLLWVLRDEAGLTGTKYGCGVGVCGACTVHLDGKAVKSCQVTLGEAAGHAVTTIEGLAARGHPAIDAWIAEQVPQCGYCQPAMVMAAAAILAQPGLSAAAAGRAMSEVLCRCGSYVRARRALERAKAGPVPAPPASAPSGGTPRHRLNPWVEVAEDGVITVRIDRAEMGQGAATGLAMLVAEELEVDLAQVRTEFAPVDAVYANPMFGVQATGGSTSVRSSFEPLRKAGAAARSMLVAAAAQAWRVPIGECQATLGAVRHRPSNRELGYGTLASAAAKQKAPANVPLKPADRFRLIGKPAARLEVPGHVRGETRYGIDVRLPGMVYGVILRPPFDGARAEWADMRRAESAPGVRKVLQIDAGLAVVADSAAAALTARTALDVRWRAGGGPDSGQIAKALDAALDRGGRVTRRSGDVDAVLRSAAGVVDATYATPFQAHAPMEPMNCTARVDAKSAEVWAPTQSLADVRFTAAETAGLSLQAVIAHSTFLGGSFGRRMDSDFVIEAVQIAKAVGRPVQLLWSRDDDMRHDAYRPANRARLRGAVAQGRIAALAAKFAGPGLALDGINMLYDVPNYREELVRVELPVRLGAWRAVGASQNAFIVEGFIDELAHAAGADALAFRVQHLSQQPRLRTVLQVAGEKSGWGAPLGAGRGRGLAAYRSFGSYIAMVAEVTVRETGAIRVDRVVVAADCGTVVNPDGVAAQLEGSVIFALGATLLSEITFRNGAVEQSSFLDYPIVRFAEAPAVEVHLVESREPPGGAGEPGVPPVAPAVVNAVFAACGKRVRALPLRL